MKPDICLLLLLVATAFAFERKSIKSTILAMSIYPSIKYHIWSKSESNLANYMSFVIFIEFVSDLDQPGTCSFICLEMTAE